MANTQVNKLLSNKQENEVKYKLYTFNNKMDPFYQPLTWYKIRSDENQCSETSNTKKGKAWLCRTIQSSMEETVSCDHTKGPLQNQNDGRLF